MFFLRDSTSGEHIGVEDPFRAYIARFLNFCHTSKGGATDAFLDAAANLRLMARILL